VQVNPRPASRGYHPAAVIMAELTSTHHDLRLGPAGVVDICRTDASVSSPFVLAIHGGAWQRREYQRIFQTLLWPKIKPLGYALVLATYRLSPEYQFPCAYDDLTQLLKWLRNNGYSYGLDAARCALLGSSAGAHLAMLLATRATQELRDIPAIRGVVQYCGIADLTAQYQFEETRGHEMVKTFMGVPPMADPKRYQEASPLMNLHRAVPPVWMAHGTADETVPVAQSRALNEKLISLGHDPVYLEARGLDHTMLERTTDGPWAEPAVLLFEHDMLRFLKCSLG